MSRPLPAAVDEDASPSLTCPQDQPWQSQSTTQHLDTQQQAANDHEAQHDDGGWDEQPHFGSQEPAQVWQANHDHHLQQQQQQHQSAVPPQPATASTLALAPGQGQEAARKQAFREVLALLLGEGPGSAKLNHMQLTAATVVAVAREAASSAAAEARQQAEQAAAASAQVLPLLNVAWATL